MDVGIASKSTSLTTLKLV